MKGMNLHTSKATKIMHIYKTQRDAVLNNGAINLCKYKSLFILFLSRPWLVLLSRVKIRILRITFSNVARAVQDSF